MTEILNFIKETLSLEYDGDITVGYRAGFEGDPPSILIIPGTEKRTVNNLGNPQDKIIDFEIEVYRDYDSDYPTEELEFTERLAEHLIRNSSEKIVEFQEVRIRSSIDEEEDIFIGTIYLRIQKRRK